MSSPSLSPRFVIFVVTSLITHILELAASGLFCHMLMQHSDLRTPWFSVAVGLLVIPTVGLQLASAVIFLGRKEDATRSEIVFTAVIHVLQLGFISRHFAILKESPQNLKRTELMEIMVLRISFAVASGSILLVIQIYLILQGYYEQTLAWTMYFSVIMNLISVIWATSTFRRCLPETNFCYSLVNWPGTILRILWRAGEIIGRVVALALFASLYLRCLAVVIGPHWLCMLVCVCIPAMTSIDWSGTSCSKRATICAMISLAYIFVFINTSSDNAVFRYTFYRVIFFLENSTLIAVWFIQSSPEDFSANSAFAYVAAVSYIASIIFMIIYHKYCHDTAAKCSQNKLAENTVWCACKFGPICEHFPEYREKGTGENWQNLNKSGSGCSHCSKKTQQDSLLDSDINSTVTISSSAARQQKLGTTQNVMRENMYSCKNRTRKDPLDICALSVEQEISLRLDAHQKCCKKLEQQSVSESGISSAGMDVKDDEEEDCEISQRMPVWLPNMDSSFANQLLSCDLNTFDSASSDLSSVAESYDCHNTNSLVPHVSSSRWSQRAATQPSSFQITNQKNNPLPDGVRALWQETPLINLSKPSWMNVPKSGNDSSLCNTCCRQISNSPSISPIKTKRVSRAEIAEEKTLNCHHNNQKHFKDANRYSNERSFPENSPEITKTNKHDCLGVQALGSSHKGKTDDSVLKVNTNRSELNKKREHSPTRKKHLLLFEKFSSPHQSAEGNDIVKTMLPHNHTCSKNKHELYELAQRHKLAAEPLKASTESDNHILEKRFSPATISNSDPRFSVRVMTSPTETFASTEDANSSVSSSKQSNRTQEQTLNCQEPETHTSKPQLNKAEKIVPDGYKMSDISINRQDDDGFQMTICKCCAGGEFNTNPDNRLTFSAAAEQCDDGVYENLWSLNPSEHVQTVTSTDSCSTEDAVDPTKWDTQIVHVHVDSEDSALPTEMFGSGRNGFTTSGSDSDVSCLEIVI